MGTKLGHSKDVPVAACHNHVTRKDFWWQVATKMPHAKDVTAAWGHKHIAKDIAFQTAFSGALGDVLLSTTSVTSVKSL